MRSGYKMAFAGLVLLFGSSAKAQAPISYHPGETIRVSVVFDGPDASKVISASMSAQLVSEADVKTQPGFSTSFGYSAGPKEGAPNTFEISFKVPDNQSKGEYRLEQISATLKLVKDGSQVGFAYSRTDFSPITFKIENSETLTKPTVKSVTVLPKT